MYLPGGAEIVKGVLAVVTCTVMVTIS